MKKLLIGLSVIFILLLAGIYSFIPDQPVISKIVLLKSTPNTSYKYLSEEINWKKWWPNNSVHLNRNTRNENDSFYYKENKYQITQAFFNTIEVHILDKNSDIKSIITIVSLKKDSVKVEWQFSFVASHNPFKRLQQYLQVKDIKINMEAILRALKSFLEKKENVYGTNIRQEKVRDTLLVATKLVSVYYPTTSDIYGLINRLRIYINHHGARETNYPMLHVSILDSSHFETMVAIPVNIALPGDSIFLFKRMVPGKILVVDVKGGKLSIDKAFAQLQNYLIDYHLESPAIPFESLVIDRLNEPDTIKWITRIYFPIF